MTKPRPYRAKSMNDGKMVYGWYFYGSGDDTHWIHSADDDSVIRVVPGTVSQYTGERDSKKKSIYEDDIVKAWIYGDEKPQELTVYWRDGGYIIDYEDSETDCTLLGWFVGGLEIIPTVE